MTTSDSECNLVAYWPQYPDITHRCTRPEGHETAGEHHWMSVEVVYSKHRRPVPSFTDPFELVPVGGRHRRPVVAAAGCGVVRRRLAVAVEAAAVVAR